MDGQNPLKQKTKHHGLRLIKSDRHEAGNSEHATEKPASSASKRNPLVKQLSALADAIDEDVKKLLNL